MTEQNTFTLPAADGAPLFVYRWLPASPPAAVIQVLHGMAEHAGRYDGLALALNGAGCAVYGHDHRGHGRTASGTNLLGYFGDGVGWPIVLDDVGVVQRRIAADFPGTPIILLGHSMGAFLAQQFAGEQGSALRALVLTGTYREARWLARAGSWLALVERRRLGPRGHSPLIRAVTFDRFNRHFAPNRTAFDWLSRDAEAIDRYVRDPHCGFQTSVQLWLEVLRALAAGLPLPPPEMPVALLVGERDPVCGADPAGRKLAADLRVQGTPLTHSIYPKARHELFHEINRDEVVDDLIAWIKTLL